MIACLVLAGCATGNDGYGRGYPGRGHDVLVGTVQQVDRGYNRIVLAVHDGGGYYGRANRVSVAYDRYTRLHYQGRVRPVENLERGDVIRVQVQRVRNDLLARSISVVHNVRDGRYGGSYGNNAGWSAVVRGRVLHVDPRARIISLDTRDRGRTVVAYDRRTEVVYAGRRYRPADLERGDIVRIRVRRYGNQWLAGHIEVERDSTRY